MKNHPLNNHVILHDGTNGAEIIAFWKEQGVDTKGYTGNEATCYYGLSANAFDYWHKHLVERSVLKVITLPKKFPPKRGDWVLVGNEYPPKKKRIFLAEIEGAVQPYMCVEGNHEPKFQSGEPFDTTAWRYISPYPEPLTFTIQEAEQKLKEVLNQEVKIEQQPIEQPNG